MDYRQRTTCTTPSFKEKNYTESMSCSSIHFLCIVLYCFVAVFAAFSKSFEDQRCGLAPSPTAGNEVVSQAIHIFKVWRRTQLGVRIFPSACAAQRNK